MANDNNNAHVNDGLANQSSMSVAELQKLCSSVNDVHELTLEERLQDTLTKVQDAAKTSTTLRDEYGNSLAAIGTDDKASKFTHYNFDNDTLNWSLWLALYTDSWVFRRAIDKPAQDEIRSGVTLQGTYNKDGIYRRLKNARFDMIQLLQWGALFGGSIAVMMFDNMEDKDYEIPMSRQKISQAKIMRFYVVDRWYGVSPTYDDMVTDMGDIDFGKPKFYNVTFADGRTIKVHHSYVLRYEHRVAPKLVKNGMLQGWGYAEGSHILNELSRDDKLKGSIQSLIDKSLIEVIKMSGMRGVFMGADSDNENQLRKRLEMVNWGRTFNSLTFLDKDDEYQMNSYSGLGGLSDLLEKNMWLISAALEMQGVLFGDLKQGFSTDSEALERYAETIMGRCESYVRPVYTKLIKVCMWLENIDEKVEFEFNSLVADKQDEKALKSMQDFVQLCSTMLNDGVITLKQYAIGIKNYTQKGVIDFELDPNTIEELDKKMSEEMESMKI